MEKVFAALGESFPAFYIDFYCAFPMRHFSTHFPPEMKIENLLNLLSHLHTLSPTLSDSYEVRYTPTKYIETNEGGLVLLAVNEGDGGRYDSYLDGTLLCSYGVTVDAHR